MTIRQSADLFCLNAQCKTKEFIRNTQKRISNGAKRIIKDENGDTNFISIAIILAVVLVVAIAFMLFKDQIMDWFNTVTSNFFAQKNVTDTKGYTGNNGNALANGAENAIGNATGGGTR